MPTSAALQHALTEPGDAPLRPLPAEAADLLRTLAAPPRLAAHLRAVHDVAAQVVSWVEDAYPVASVDRTAVLFGAATHDIGKTVLVDRLAASGEQPWQAFRKLDDQLDRLAAGADGRLAFQNAYPV